MRKQSRIISRLSLVAVCVGAMVILYSTGAFRTNLLAIRETASFLHVSPETINEVYWDAAYDWHNSNEVTIDLDASATDGEVMISVLKAALQGHGEQVLLVGQKHTNTCLRRLSCRMLYARAAFALDRKDLIRFQVLDDELWHALAGRGAPQVRTQEELVSYQQYYEALLPLFPNKPELFYILGSINRTRGGWSKALPYYEEALALAPDNARYRCNVGESLVYSDADPERGLVLCEEAIQHSPDDLWLYETAGRAHARYGRCDEALALYEEAVRRFSKRTEPGVWLANLRIGKVEKCPASG